MNDYTKKQFALCKNPDHLNPEFVSSMNKYTLKQWTMFVGTDLPRYPVISNTGEQIGIVFGWLTHTSNLVNDNIAAPTKSAIETIETMLLRWTDALSGRYLACLIIEGEMCILNDPGGQFPILHHCDKPLAVTTPGLLNRYLVGHQALSLKHAIEDGANNYWYPFGLTPTHKIKRLLPNHLLTLDSSTTKRIWPTKHEIGEFTKPQPRHPDLSMIAATLATEFERIVQSSNTPPYLHITGGYDSRIALATSIAIDQKLPLVAIDFDNANCRRDIKIARQLAKICNRSLDIRNLYDLKTTDAVEWQLATGGLVQDTIGKLPTTQKRWSRTEEQIAGTGGEVGRAFYWSIADINRPKPSAQQLLERLNIPCHPQIVDAAEQWLKSTPDLPAHCIYDLAYIEQRLGCWAGANMPGIVQQTPPHSPFISRRLFTYFMSLEPRYRAKQQFAKDLIDLLAPELSNIPFNRVSGLRVLTNYKDLFRFVIPDHREKQLKFVFKSL